MINFLNSVQSASTPEPFPAPDHSIIEEELHHSDEPELKCGRWFFKASPTIYVAASTSSSQTLLKSSHEAVRPTLPFLRYQIPSREVQLKNTWRVMLQRNVRIIPNVIPNISPTIITTIPPNITSFKTSLCTSCSWNTSWAFCTVCGLWPVLCRSCRRPEGLHQADLWRWLLEL